MCALRLTVIGTGYLGATHAVCMADFGFEVLGMDGRRVDKVLIVPPPKPEPEEEEADG